MKIKQRLLTILFFLLLSSCSSQPEHQRSVPWSQFNPWLVADFHTHSQFSDGSLEAGDLIEEAAIGGCEIVALTDHSDNTIKVTTATPAYFSRLRQLRKQFRGLIIVGGIEWNIPPYNGREHVNLLVTPEIEDSILNTFREQFQSESSTAQTALEWLTNHLTPLNQAILFYNHPSRKVNVIKESGSDIKKWRSTSKLMIGFEGGPGHQHSSNIGSYKKPSHTEDRWDPVVSEIGGVWDNLLDQGEDVWGALANSDFHNKNLDFLPCRFSRTHIQIPERNIAGVIEGLRAGSFWADHGRILSKLVFTVDTPGLDFSATPGEIITTNLNSPLTVNLNIERDQGSKSSPLYAELISNCSTGKPALINTLLIATNQSSATWTIDKPQQGSDAKSCYLRIRVRKKNLQEPDLMAYSNPIRVTFQPEWPGRLQKLISIQDSFKISNIFSSLNSSPYLFSLLVVIFLIVIFALIYFYKFSRRKNDSSRINPPKGIKYDSKISLCTLVFDKLKSVLYLSYGENTSRISFAELKYYEVVVNTHRLIKFNRNNDAFFNAEAMNNLRFTLHQIEKEKLLENETRQVDLNIIYKQKTGTKSAPVNFYYREGNIRLSPSSFSTSVDDIVAWCGLLDSALRFPVAKSK